jgi:hypothetical protein
MCELCEQHSIFLLRVSLTDSLLFTLNLVCSDSVLPHLTCSTIASLVRKEKKKEQMFSSGALPCILFPFLYLASR